MAKTTFLPDQYEDLGISDYNTIDNDYTSQNCDDYPLSLCPEGAFCEQCPFDVSLYRVYGCKSPYLESGDSCVCPPSVTLTQPNDVCTKYCGADCIEMTCIPTENQTGCTNGTQACEDGCGSYSRLCCVPCEHLISYKPANSSYTYQACTDGDGEHQIQTDWECNAGYHEKNEMCEKDCIANTCSDYELDSCPDHANCSECSLTATDCSSSGTKYRFDSCQAGYHLSNGSCEEDCSADACSDYPLSSCPTNGLCTSCQKKETDCSVGERKYKLTACAEGYKKSGNECVKKTCSPITCDSSYNSSRPIPCSGKGLSLVSCTPINSDCSQGTTKYKCLCTPYRDSSGRLVQCSLR